MATLNKENLEMAALGAAVTTHLSSLGFTGIPIHMGFAVGDQIEPPLISVYFLANGPKPLQLGNTTEKLFQRVVQFDVYMESQSRVELLVDILMDYLDTMAVTISDPLQNDASVGSITCQDTDSIYGQIMTPNFEKPKVIRWRGITRGTLEMHYPEG